MPKQDSPKTPFPKGRANSSFPAGKKTSSKQPQKGSGFAVKSAPKQIQKDNFSVKCEAYLAAHKDRFGEVRKAAPGSGFAFECVRRDTKPYRIYHIAVAGAEKAGAALVEKTAEKLGKILEDAPDGCGHQAVIMVPGIFSADAQSAAITCNVLLISGRTMAK